MVICLLLGAAALLWPGRSRAGLPARRRATRAAGGGDSAAALAGEVSRRSAPCGRRGVPAAGPHTLRMLLLAGAIGVVAVLFVVAGLIGALAAGAAMATGALLVRRWLVDRSNRVAMIDIQSALRILGRELRAGAEPSVAAVNASAAANREGARVLQALARLTRADDRPSVGVRSSTERPVNVGYAIVDSRDTGIPGSAATRQVDLQVQARLRSGWLLTRRHGLAFTPLIDALVADLSEQILAEADRAGQVAGPRMSGYVMAVLPLMGLVLGVGMGADPFRVLLLTPVGNILLLVGVVLTCAGLLWSAQIVRR